MLLGEWKYEWSPISGESAAWLEHAFSEEEVHLMVFQLNKEKVPGMVLPLQCIKSVGKIYKRTF